MEISKSNFIVLLFVFVFAFSPVAQAQLSAPTLVKKPYTDFSSLPFGFTTFNGSIYFFASRSLLRNDNISLWKSDGSENGTIMVKDSVGFKTFGELPEIKILNNHMFFLACSYTADSAFISLWKSDGTENGTQVLRKGGRDFSGGTDNVTGQLTPFNGKLYFNFYDSTGGSEPFYSDGTSAGTKLLKDIQTEPTGFNSTPSYPHRFTVIDNTLYFWAIPNIPGFGLNETLFKTDGTSANTIAVKQFGGGLNQIQYLSHLIPYNGKIYFSGRSSPSGGYELWSSDGTEAGTQQVKEINSGLSNSGDGVSPIFDAQVFKNRLYFWGFEPGSGQELWSTDGSPAGTTLLKNTNATTNPNVNRQQYNSNPFFVFGDKMYYGNNDGLAGREPWVTDGTVTGTKMFADVYPGTFGSSATSNYGFSVIDGKMYFRASNGTGVQICSADTTTAIITSYPVTSGFFSAEIPYELQLIDDESFSFLEFSNQIFFPGGFHPTSSVPAYYSNDLFKLALAPTGILAERQSRFLSVFPNPSFGKFFLNCKGPEGEFTVEVFNSMGQGLWKSNQREGQNQIEINLTGQPSGIYRIKCQGENFNKVLSLQIH